MTSEKANENYKLRTDYHQMNPAAGHIVPAVCVTEYTEQIKFLECCLRYTSANFFYSTGSWG